VIVVVDDVCLTLVSSTTHFSDRFLRFANNSAPKTENIQMEEEVSEKRFQRSIVEKSGVYFHERMMS